MTADQPAAAPMTGSSSDEKAGRVRAFLHGYREDDDSEIIEHINRDVTLTVGDLRALLNEREQLRELADGWERNCRDAAAQRNAVESRLEAAKVDMILLRQGMEAATARAKQAEALAAERVEAARQREETWRDSAMQANAELAKLRAGLGETRDEWGVRGGGGTFPVFDEAEARWHTRGPAEPMTPVRRLVGEWRETAGGDAT